jgi:hypothetical protein
MHITAIGDTKVAKAGSGHMPGATHIHAAALQSNLTSHQRGHTLFLSVKKKNLKGLSLSVTGRCNCQIFTATLQRNFKLLM